MTHLCEQLSEFHGTVGGGAYLYVQIIVGVPRNCGPLWSINTFNTFSSKFVNWYLTVFLLQHTRSLFLA